MDENWNLNSDFISDEATKKPRIIIECKRDRQF